MLPVPGQAVQARVDAIMRDARYRECILKSHVLNQYEMFITCAGMIISADMLGKLVAVEFSEVVATDPATARDKLAFLRTGLIERYPFWIPNKLRLPTLLSWMKVAHRDRAKALFSEYLPLIDGMVVDSDHYAQLWIDCRHNPLSVSEPWFKHSGARPWHLPWAFFAGMRKAWGRKSDQALMPKFDERLVMQRLGHE